MPAEYRAAFEEGEARAHQAVVGRRGDRVTHLEVWRQLSDHIVAVCVVADDRPGLLSRISAALVAERIDVVGAHAYCRARGDGSKEAIDLLWIRRLPAADGLVPPIRDRDIEAVASAIAASATRDGALAAEPTSSERASHLARTASARIRFHTHPTDGSTTLTVEAVDRPGLLLAVTQALFRAGVQIIALRATTERGSAVDRFTLTELDGSPLQSDRLLMLQAAILGALDERTLASAPSEAG